MLQDLFYLYRNKHQIKKYINEIYHWHISQTYHNSQRSKNTDTRDLKKYDNIYSSAVTFWFVMLPGNSSRRIHTKKSRTHAHLLVRQELNSRISTHTNHIALRVATLLSVFLNQKNLSSVLFSRKLCIQICIFILVNFVGLNKSRIHNKWNI